MKCNMSYQFEDDSALEELLNQQLDRRKPTQPSSGAVDSCGMIKPAQRTRTDIVQTSHSISLRPQTAGLNKQPQFAEDPTPSPTGTLKNKLSSWLDAKDTEPLEADLPNPLQVRSLGDTHLINHLPRKSLITTTDDDQASIDRLLGITSVQLQGMSKQRLIQFIQNQILPTIENLNYSASKNSDMEVARLKGELEFERSKQQTMELRYSEQIKLAESMWIQLNKQLESKLVSNEQAMKQMSESNKILIEQLEEEHKQELNQLVLLHRTRRDEDREQFEITLKRREEFHRLEMESKLKVNYDIVKLDTIFAEWHKMIGSMFSNFELQLKSVDEYLDRQTIEINSSNQELAKKTKLLLEHFARFESQNNLIDDLAKNINSLLPCLASHQRENERLSIQSSAQLTELQERDARLADKESELDRLKDELTSVRDKLNKEKFEIGLDANRLAYKEERLNELMYSNEETERGLKKECRMVAARETRLAETRASLESKGAELKSQNYDLHLLRKRLQDEEEQLSKRELQLSNEWNLLREQQKQVERETDKLVRLRDRIKKELAQLRRLQNSLVCSICLDRLFKQSNLKPPTWNLDHSKFEGHLEQVSQWQNLMSANEISEKTTGTDIKETKTKFEFDSRLASDLVELSRQMHLDVRKLKYENKYVSLINRE